VDIFTSIVSSVLYFRGPGGTQTVGKVGKDITYRGSPLVCVVRNKTRVCLDIVGWTLRVLKEVQVFLAHFYTMTTVTKTNTDTFSWFLVLNSHVPPRRREIIMVISHDFGTNCMSP